MQQKSSVFLGGGGLVVLGLLLSLLGQTAITYQLIGIISFALGLVFLSWLSPRPRLNSLVIAVLLFLLIGFVFDFSPVDDTFITLRYARNFSKGLGLVFNRGERVEGYTSFLWTLLLGMTAKLGLPLVLTARFLSVAFALGVLLVLLKLVTLFSADDRQTYYLIVLGGSLVFVFWSFTGMETSFAAFWFFLSVYWLLIMVNSIQPDTKTTVLAGFFLALAALSRPEVYLIVPLNLILLVLLLPPHWRLKTTGLYFLTFFLVFGPVFIGKYLYYGLPFPNTFYTKVNYSSASLMLYGLKYLMKGIVAHLPLFVLFALGFLVRPKEMFTKNSRYLLALCLAIVFTIIYTGADHFAGYRFFYNLLPLVIILSLPALDWLQSIIKTERHKIHLTALLSFGVMLLTLLTTFYWQSMGFQLSRSASAHLAGDLAKVGKWLKQEAGPPATLAAPVIGALPYYAELTTYDMYGLTDSHIARRSVKLGSQYKDHEKYDMNYLVQRKPDYIFIGLFRSSSPVDLLSRPAMPGYLELYSLISFKQYQVLSGNYQGVDFTFLVRGKETILLKM